MFETEAERLAHLQARVDTIQRAIRIIERTDAARLALVLRNAEIKPHLRDSPGSLAATLREGLKDGASTGHRFGAWKASQRICKAAGLRY